MIDILTDLDGDGNDGGGGAWVIVITGGNKCNNNAFNVAICSSFNCL